MGSSKKGTRIIELVACQDIEIKKGNTALKRVGVEDHTPHKRMPLCHSCGCTRFVELQVLGTVDKPLLWMCDECEEVYLKYDPNYTEKLLIRAEKFWTVPQHWGSKERPEA